MPTPDTNIIFFAELLRDADFALRREWLVTNGLGGYASASLTGANTRRYHGLLVAALDAPLGRSVLLSKLDETVRVTDAGGQETVVPLATNLYPNVMEPQGYRLLESWEAYPAPRWIFAPMAGVRIEKTVWMAPKKNTTYVSYKLLDAPANVRVVLNLLPLLAWKDYHSEMHRSDSPQTVTWENSALRVVLPGVWNITPGAFPLTLAVVTEDGTPFAKADFTNAPDWYYRFQHPREQERGLDCEEDSYTPGTLQIELSAGETVAIAATVETDTPDAPGKSWANLTARQAALAQAVGTEPFAQQLAWAAEAFRVQVPGKRATLIAGYPWFADWGRDTMIALPGLCLTTGQTDMAREILLSFAATVSEGMLPNRFPDSGETPEYNTADATLWYFVAIYRYLQATGDLATVRDSLWSVLEDIIAYHEQGTRYNIHAAPTDNLLYAGQAGVQLTWMDAKVGDWVVTPRIGKPVEVNALWCNALATMTDIAAQIGDAVKTAQYATLAQQAAESFRARFPRPDGLGLYDVLDTPPEKAPDSAIRPNQIFAVSLPFAPLEPNSPVAASVVQTVQDELLTPVGLRTLSPYDPAYCPRYEGNPLNRDGAYHQGTAWPWLLGPFAEAHYKVNRDSAAALSLLLPLQAQLRACGVGSLAEIYDGGDPQRPNGCIAQAWSVGETLRVLVVLTK